MARRKNPIPLEHQRPRDLSKLQSRRVEPQFENKEMTFWISDPEEPRLPTFFEDWGIKYEGKDEVDNSCDRQTYEMLDLRHLSFEGASLIGASFLNCDMRWCKFSYSIMIGTSFQDSNLSNANFERILTFRLVNFENCDLRGANFDSRNHDKKDLVSCNWMNSNIDGANFTDQKFILYFLETRKHPNSPITILGTPSFKDARLQDAELKDANLQNFDLRYANFNNANLENANLQGANLQDSRIKNANLRGADLSYANLKSVDFRGSDLSNTNLQGAIYNRATNYTFTEDELSVMVLDDWR